MASIHEKVLLFALSVAACGGGGKPAPDGNDEPPGNDITVEIHRKFPFVDGDTIDNAKFVAVQDGDGAFVAATGENGVYRVRVASDRFGIAVGCGDTNFVSIEIVQRVLADGTTYRTACTTPPSTAHLEITVKNLPANHRLRLRSDINIHTVSKDGTTTFDLPPGNAELFATETDADKAVVQLFRIPAIPVTTTAAVTIDVAKDGVAPEFHPLTVTPPDPMAAIHTSVARPYGTINLQQAPGLPAGANPMYFSLPAKLQQPDDLYRVTVAGETSVTRTFKTAGAFALTQPSPFATTTATLAKTPLLHPIWTFTPTAAQLPIQSYRVEVTNFLNFDDPILRDWFATLSSGWVGAVPTMRYEFPDLSQIPGFSELALKDRQRLDSSIDRNETTADPAVDGTIATSSSAAATLGEFCGDGVVQSAFETCDPGPVDTESATCDSDCTAVKCGDSVINNAAGEECDPPNGTTCDATCKAI